MWPKPTCICNYMLRNLVRVILWYWLVIAWRGGGGGGGEGSREKTHLIL